MLLPFLSFSLREIRIFKPFIPTHSDLWRPRGIITLSFVCVCVCLCLLRPFHLSDLNKNGKKKRRRRKSLIICVYLFKFCVLFFPIRLPLKYLFLWYTYIKTRNRIIKRKNLDTHAHARALPPKKHIYIVIPWFHEYKNGSARLSRLGSGFVEMIKIVSRV